MKFLKHVVMTAGVIAVISSNSGRADNFDYVMSTLQSSGTSDVLCQQGDAGRKVFSLRSFNGVLGLNKYTGALALVLCKGYPDFQGSQCYKNAIKTLKGADPTQVLKEGLNKKTTSISNGICKNIHKFPSVFQVTFSSACR